MKKMRYVCVLAAAVLAVGLTGCGKADKKLPEVDMSTVNDLSYEGYHLVWADEFNGEELNREDWNVELHEPGWVNKELQEYVDSTENIYLEDGNLVLMPVQTKREDGSYYYTSGRVSTQHKKVYTYGMFECRAKVPAGKGYLPAFWLMSDDENIYGQWPRCGEIDCMEVLGDDLTNVHGTIHYGNPHNQSQGTYTLSESDFSEDFHTFTCEWEPGKITWYCDGIKYHEEDNWFSTTEGQGTLTYPAPFDSPFYIILNLAVGGEWVGYPSNESFEAQPYIIDYVRVFQKDSYDENVVSPLSIFEPRDAAGDGNYIANGDFSEAVEVDAAAARPGSEWSFLLFDGGDGSAEIVDGELVITTKKSGNVDYSIQLVQPNVPIEKGGTYRVSFDARSDEFRRLHLALKAPDRGWVEYLPTTIVNITPEMKTYTYEFTMSEISDENGRLEFNMGSAGSTGLVILDNVRVEKIGQEEVSEDVEKTVLADGNYLYNGKFWEGDSHVGFWDITNDAGSEMSVTSFADGRRLKFVNKKKVGLAQVSIAQSGLAITGEESYHLSFDIEVDKKCTISVNVGGDVQTVDLAKGRQTVNLMIDAGKVTTDTFELQLGVPGTVLVDSVMLSR